MKASEALIAWTPANATDDETAGQVKIGPLLRQGQKDWARPFSFTGGAAHVNRRAMTGPEQTLNVFLDFHGMVVRDKIDPQVAHEAFLGIDEYAEAIAPDIRGAREPE